MAFGGAILVLFCFFLLTMTEHWFLVIVGLAVVWFLVSLFKEIFWT